MASRKDVVKISYKDLENIVLTHSKKTHIVQGKDVKPDTKRKPKRPERGIYQPPSVLRHKQQSSETEDRGDGNNVFGAASENWEDETFDQEVIETSSRENSIEKDPYSPEVENMTSSLKNVHLMQSPITRGRVDQKRRKKHPDIQVYVPKGKLVEQQILQTDTPDYETTEVYEKSENALETERRVDMRNMQVTVANDHASVSRPDTIGEEAKPGKHGNPENVITSVLHGESIGTQAKDSCREQKENSRDSKIQSPVNRWSNSHPESKSPTGKQTRTPHVWHDIKTPPTDSGNTKQNTGQGRYDRRGRRDSEKESQEKESYSNQRKNSLSDNKRDAMQVAYTRRGSYTENKKDVKGFHGKQETYQRRQSGVSEKYDRGYHSNTNSLERVKNTDSRIETMVFERSDQSGAENDTNFPSDYKYQTSKNTDGNKTSKRYSLSAMRRQRTGSFSSDISSSSDFSIEDEEPAHILDWNKEVEREMAEQVQQETLKLKEFLDQQEEISYPALLGYGDQNETSKSNTIPRSKPRKSRPDDRGREPERRRGSLQDVRSRESSVHSVQSLNPEDGRGYRRRGRRRNRKNSTSSQRSQKSISRDRFDNGLQITFAGNESRKVKMQSNERLDHNKYQETYDKKTRHGQQEVSWRQKDSANRFRDHDWTDKKDRFSTMNQYNQGKKSRSFEFSKYEHGNYKGKANDRNLQKFNNQDARMEHDFIKGGSQYRKQEYEEGRSDQDKRQSRISEQKNFQHGGYSGPGGRQHKPPRGAEIKTPKHHGGLIHLPQDASLHQEVTYNYHGNESLPPRFARSHYNSGHEYPKSVHNQKDSFHGQQFQNGMGKKVLFDPKNPSKPIVMNNNSSLKFEELSPEPEEFKRAEPSYPPDYMRIPYGSYYGQGYPHPLPQFREGVPQRLIPPGYYYGYPSPHIESALYQDDTYSRDPYYHSGYDQEHLIEGRNRAQCRITAEHALREAGPLDNKLCHLLARRLGDEEGLKNLKTVRHDLQCKYEKVILMDPDLANKHNVEQLMWKSVYYQVIEVLRKQHVEDKDDETKSQLLNLLHETLSSELYDTFTHGGIYVLCYAFYGFIGHFAPICVNSLSGCHYQQGRGRLWYSKAQQIAPKNGRPYNQLAILALYTRRKLDAVYYYMRSLAASNPFLTARESLMSLFDEATKKARTASERKRLDEKQRMQKLKQKRKQHGHRIEIWISSDGTSSQDKVDDNYEEDLSRLDAVELNKRFVLSFLNVHGKLFTKIGMETFSEICCQMLHEFRALLHHGAIGPTRLLQLAAINMFAIENTALQDHSLEDTCRSLLQEHAVQQGLEMFGILIEKCCELLLLHMDTPDYPARMFNRDLEELVPAVKAWSDWMVCHASLWSPPPALRNPACGPDCDVWKATGKLCNILKDIDISHVVLYQEKKEGCDPLLLMEDTMLAGFVPLLSAPFDITYVHSTVDKDIAMDCLRIEKIQRFGDYLCGIEPPMLEYSVERKEYYSVAPPTLSVEEENEQDEQQNFDAISEDEVIIENEDDVFDDEDGEHVRHLKAKKEELKKKMAEKAKHEENIQKFLEKNRHRSIELEIRPIFLIPDTNCFIEYFQNMKNLLESEKYTIVIPLTVINELDGLAKGGKEGNYDSTEHAVKVKVRAKETIEYLEEKFEKKHPHLRAQTSKGSLLETIAFRSEETDGSGNNDDLILSCCLHYCKDKAKDYMQKDKDAPVRLYRDVVLLTDDRNLRLKAHTHNVPVKDVPSFLKWSKVT
ncbi:hypothetical protein ScPMuIL_006843 [Solemya velum]